MTHSALIRVFRQRRGVSLVEILLGLLIVTIDCIGTLSYFAYGMGGIGKQGNRRAALERARERLEQLLATPVGSIQPPDTQLYWLTCTGTPCTWTRSSARVTQNVSVDDLTSQPIETTVQWVDDPSAGTTTPDVLNLGVKIWFLGTTVDDDFHRVYVRTLRTP